MNEGAGRVPVELGLVLACLCGRCAQPGVRVSAFTQVYSRASVPLRFRFAQAAISAAAFWDPENKKSQLL